VLLFQTAKIYGQLAVTAERLREESLTDALTGLANRRSFEQHFGEVLRECARDLRPVAVLMIDIDQFKLYNDAFGHLSGDACLRTIAQILERNIGRTRDMVARIGGEEMAVVMPNADAAGAAIVAERMRAAVRAAEIAHGNAAAYPVVTISIGVAATRDPARATIEQLVLAADKALYRAKWAGRDRVVESLEPVLSISLPDA
jgi:diguanylate cyclase (GGDEF)-like protein